MPEQPKSERSPFFGFWILLTILLGGYVIGVGINIFNAATRQRDHDAWEEPFRNARSLGLSLFEFDVKYGSFPCDATIKKIQESGDPGSDLSGTSSNAFFRQLFAAQITKSETIYFAKIRGTHNPDGIITAGEVLKKGEVGFSYVTNLSTADDPATPIVLTPLIPGTTTFDRKPFNEKAVILHIDNSVRTYPIQKDGHIYDKGIDLLSPKHPVWKGKAPDIRYPE